MPRPGPRPYECVRRAWHSERHQPMRGSLIKEIFRVAHEIHSLPTKKNREWQEKLPIVVLKAEEIMYSKANSEAEYMDPKTLLERVNDAVDTIIRRDEGDETGELLQPCIEAALHLGCIPRRASRSQRNSDPSFYLGPYSLDKGNGALKTSSSLAPQQPNLFKSNLLGKVPQKCDFHILNGDMNILPAPASLRSISYPVYPLYYGTHPHPPLESQHGFMGLPIDIPKMSFVNDQKMQHVCPCDKDSSNTVKEGDQPEELACDLSLRLAPLSVSVTRANVGSNVSLMREDAKLNDFSIGKQKHKVCPDLCLFSGHSIVGSEKRNRMAREMEEDQQFARQPKRLCTFSQDFQCRVLHPKICQLAESNPETIFLKVNHQELKKMCYTLHINVLPFFRFYRGSKGRLCSFSCTLSTINKFKDTLVKWNSMEMQTGVGDQAKGLEVSELLSLAEVGEISRVPETQLLGQEMENLLMKIMKNSNLPRMTEEDNSVLVA